MLKKQQICSFFQQSLTAAKLDSRTTINPTMQLILPSPFRSTCGSYADAPVQMPAMTAGRFGNYWPFEGCHATLRGAELSIAGHFATSLPDRTSCCSFRNPFGPEVHARSPPPSGFMTWLVGLVRQIWKHKTLRGNLAKRFSLFFFSGWLGRYTDTVRAINRR